MKKKLISLLLAGVLVFGILTNAFADEISDLESENEYTEQQLLDLKDSINDIENQKTELLGDIDAKEKELVLTLATISTLTGQVDLKNQELAQTTKDLKTAKEDESTQYEAMKKRIQYLYETGGDAGWAVILLEDLSITEFLNRAEYTQQMYEYDRRCLEEYAATVQKVSTLKEQEEEEKTDLERMLANQEEQQTYLEEQLTKLRAESDDYEKKLAEATTTADAYVELINQQNSMIQELLDEQERQRAAQEEANRIAEEQAAAAEEAARAAAEAEAAAQAAVDDAARAQAEAEAEAARQAAAAAEAEAQNAAAEAERARQEEEALAAAMQQTGEVQQDAGAAEVQQDYTEEPQEIQAEEPYVPEQPQISIPAGYPNVDRAAAWIGIAEYSYGACSPGVFDCSGFVSYCVTGGYTRVGTAYSFMTGFPQVTDPIPGDIASNGGHCGIYIGNGMMIHCADYGIGVIVGPVADNMIFTRY